jgi:hypothetical protein
VSGPRRGPAGAIIAGPTDELGASYDGSVPFPGSSRPPSTVGGSVRTAVTAAIVLVPFAGLGVAVWLAWGHGLGLADVLVALAFYVLSGLGVSVGFHRLFTHRSFTAVRPLRIALAVAGSMSFEGPVIGRSPSTAAITPSPTGPATRTLLTATAPAWPASCAGWPTPMQAGCCVMTPRRPRATLPTCWPTPPCGWSRPDSPP